MKTPAIPSKFPFVFDVLHNSSESLVASGNYQTKIGKGIILKTLSKLVAMPPSVGASSFRLIVDRSGKREKWTRFFQNKKFVTRVRKDDLTMTESLGIFSFKMEIEIISTDTMLYNFIDLKVLGVKLPKWLSISTTGKCIQINNEEWSFNINVIAPTGHSIINYWGRSALGQ